MVTSSTITHCSASVHNGWKASWYRNSAFETITNQIPSRGLQQMSSILHEHNLGTCSRCPHRPRDKGGGSRPLEQRRQQLHQTVTEGEKRHKFREFFLKIFRPRFNIFGMAEWFEWSVDLPRYFSFPWEIRGNTHLAFCYKI